LQNKNTLKKKKPFPVSSQRNVRANRRNLPVTRLGKVKRWTSCSKVIRESVAAKRGGGGGGGGGGGV